MAPIQIEQTSKPIKAIMALGVLLMFAAVAVAWQTWGTSHVAVAAWLFGGGCTVYGGARLASWWQSG